MTHYVLSQQAYQSIKRKIVYLELEPGAVIDEAVLQDSLGLGRTPIREALQRLEQEKLVTIVPRRGMFVSEISVTDLYQIFELRLTVEALAVRLAARRGSETHWQQMEAVLNSIPWHDATDQQLIEIDEACHAIIYAAADNHFLEDMLTTCYAPSAPAPVDVFFAPHWGYAHYRRNTSNAYRSLRDGDADEAALAS
ncbi:MAG: GntR family transcriptional regulator [Anaerolineae bacterium]|nr:GntR family transcriptional regulator [Anaerolineae bacterium]